MTTGRVLRATILGLIAVLAVGGPARARVGQKWALLVGIDSYERSDVTPLRFAVADVKAVARTLEAVAGFRPDHVFLLTSDRKGDQAATRTNVAFRLDWLAGKVRPDDTVVFFFSGHGMEMDEGAWLLTQEADPRSKSTLEESGLGTGRLQIMLKGLKAEHLLVFVDACRSDPRAGRGGGDNRLGKGLSRDLCITSRKLPASARDPVSATFFACSPGQRSYEWPDQRHGFFTEHLLLGLKGRAADARGRVTTQSLMAYLSKAVPSSTDRVLNVRQVPWIKAEGSGMVSWALATVRLRPHAAAAGALARRGLRVRIASPTAGTVTERPTVSLAATVTGGAVSSVEVAVNGRAVPLGKSRVERGSRGGAITVAVPLEAGENTIVVTAMGASGEPAQSAVTVQRTGSNGASLAAEAGQNSGTGPVASADISSSWKVTWTGIGPFQIGMAKSAAGNDLRAMAEQFDRSLPSEDANSKVDIKETDRGVDGSEYRLERGGRSDGLSLQFDAKERCTAISLSETLTDRHPVQLAGLQMGSGGEHRGSLPDQVHGLFGKPEENSSVSNGDSYHQGRLKFSYSDIGRLTGIDLKHVTGYDPPVVWSFEPGRKIGPFYLGMPMSEAQAAFQALHDAIGLKPSDSQGQGISWTAGGTRIEVDPDKGGKVGRITVEDGPDKGRLADLGVTLSPAVFGMEESKVAGLLGPPETRWVWPQRGLEVQFGDSGAQRITLTPGMPGRGPGVPLSGGVREIAGRWKGSFVDLEIRGSGAVRAIVRSDSGNYGDNNEFEYMNVSDYTLEGHVACVDPAKRLYRFTFKADVRQEFDEKVQADFRSAGLPPDAETGQVDGYQIYQLTGDGSGLNLLDGNTAWFPRWRVERKAGGGWEPTLGFGRPQVPTSYDRK